ncbi:MAG: acylphosphatase [archaeon]
MKRLHITISGNVQGVSFRYYAKLRAKELFLDGWIKNVEFNKVEIVIEGKDDEVDMFLEWCKEGPYYTDIEDIKIEEEDFQREFKDFEVRY